MTIMLALPGCRKNSEARTDPAWWTLETERLELAQKVELLKVKLSKVENRHQDVDGMVAELKQETDRRARLEDQVAALSAEVAELSSCFKRDREEWIRVARGKAMGRTFATFSGAGGKTYQDVEITAITDIGVEFKHATGSARLAATDLTWEQQAEFGVDPREAQEALVAERENAKAYGSWVDNRVASAMAKKEAAEAARVAAAPVKVRPQPVVASTSSSSSGSRLRDQARSFGRGNTIWYPSYTRVRYPYGYGVSYGSRSYSAVRVPSSSWSFTPSRTNCYTRPPVVKPRSSSFYNTP
ncbi:hypothetical protein [Luteolibacter marinus]|uniref:hypothetical protein n=1 Tax=Luteolibacter marinus TaxID=2776705 RepID=UPI0018667F3A|nr:hypothetical protein [Luteolibacter marinus]